jgi:hypothetical protein
MVSAWMIISDICNHTTVGQFKYTSIQKHSDSYLNVPSFYFPCSFEDLNLYKEIESKRIYALYVDFLICTQIFAKFKVYKIKEISL